ncbi:hypothetical protein [Brevibacillus migulae]|uniref:hypothetical protein n=1 Tax=Brevibacillus migulae TaxID=1644114 RepID=UPI00106E0706|nr:hypothetical protein [Brevibacillus migulae]
MAEMFDSFWSELSKRQISLLLDTVLYFEDASKLLSLPSTEDEHIAVPLLPETLRQMLEALSNAEESEKRRFQFTWNPDGQQTGELVVLLPDGRQLLQKTDLSAFSPV